MANYFDQFDAGLAETSNPENAGNFFDQFDYEQEEEEEPGVGDAVKETVKGIGRGVVHELPKMAGEALEFFGAEEAGPAVQDWAEQNLEDLPSLQPAEWVEREKEEDAFSIKAGAAEAGEMLAPSMGLPLAGAAIGSVFPVIGTAAGAAAGFVLSLPLFFGSAAKSTYDNVYEGRRHEIGDEAAHDLAFKTGLKSGAIEAGGEALADIVTFRLFRLLPSAVKKDIVKAATKGIRGPKAMIKDLAAITAAEVGTELGQNLGQLAVEAGAGVGPGANWDDVKGVIVPTAILAIFTMGGAEMVGGMRRTHAAKVLADPNAPAAERVAAVKAIAAEVGREDAELANMWLRHSIPRLKAGQAIVAEEDNLYRKKPKLPVKPEDLVEAGVEEEKTTADREMVPEAADIIEGHQGDVQGRETAHDEAEAAVDIPKADIVRAVHEVKAEKGASRRRELERAQGEEEEADRQVELSEFDPGEAPPNTDLADKLRTALDQNAHEAATSPTNDKSEPTPGQISAGNYEKGHQRIGGQGYSFENPEGSTRRSKPGAEKGWEIEIQGAHYGYAVGTESTDGAEVDVFVKPGTRTEKDLAMEGRPRDPEAIESKAVYVIDQVNPKTQEFDEPKVMLGYDSQEEATDVYLSNYEANWKGLGDITAMTHEEYRGWVSDKEATKRPAAQAARRMGVPSAQYTPGGAVDDVRRAETDSFFGGSSLAANKLQTDFRFAIIGSPSGVDDLFSLEYDGWAEERDAAYDAFSGTRAALRREYGEYVELHRADVEEGAKIDRKATLLYADKAQAKLFMEEGRKLVKEQVLVDDIILAPLLEGGYTEFVVRNRASNSGLILPSGHPHSEKSQRQDSSADEAISSLRQFKGSVLANRIPKDFKDRSQTSLIGQTIESAGDLAVLAQVYRNPAFETLRFFFMKGGKVVGQTGVTSRLPGSISPFTGKGDGATESFDEKMRAQIKSLGADGYWMVHNHPTGDPTPSKGDKNATVAFAKAVDGFLGHVIINENKFAALSVDVERRMVFKDKAKYKQALVSKQFDLQYSVDENPTVPHPALLSASLPSDEDVARLAKQVQVTPGYIVAIALGGNTVSGIMEVSPEEMSFSRKGRMKAAAILRRFAKQTGGQDIFLAEVPNTKKWREAIVEAVRYGLIRDGVDVNGESMKDAFQTPWKGYVLGKEAEGFSLNEPKPPYRTEKGRYVGAPEWVKSPQALGKMRKLLRQLVDEGKSGRFWYERSGAEILELTDSYEDAEILTQLIAIYSPQNKVFPNMTQALQAYYQWKADVPRGEFIVRPFGNEDAENLDDKAVSLLFDGQKWSGRKTNSFYLNLMSEINRQAGKDVSGVVTVDTWIARAMGYTRDTIPSDSSNPDTRNSYTFSENEITTIAEELGWEPRQAQAAIWVGIKARHEQKAVKDKTKKRSVQKGWSHYDEDGKWRAPTTGWKKKKHRWLWRTNALKAPLDRGTVEKAGFDYSDAMNQMFGQISIETLPGATTGRLPELRASDIHTQLRYHRAIMEVLFRNGEDRIGVQIGLITGQPLEGPGAWESFISPGTQVPALIPKQRKSPTNAAFSDPATKEIVDLYSYIAGYVLEQDAVGWHRPFYAALVRESNGMEIDIGRPITYVEAWKLYRNVMEVSGRADIVPIPFKDGVRFLNFEGDTGINNKAFHGIIRNAVDAVFADLDVEPVRRRFGTDGNLITNDWQENPNGEEYRRRIQDPSRPESLWGWVSTVLAPEVGAARDAFAEEQGWGTATPTEQRRERVHGDEAAGDGRGFTEFFANVTAGIAGRSDTGAPFVPTIPAVANDLGRRSPVSSFAQEYAKHRGNFDDHIALSIPGHREVQIAVGAAIARSVGNGRVLDIGASEGSFIKSITAESEGRITTVGVDPNPKMAEHFESHSQVEGSRYDMTAFVEAGEEGKLQWTEDSGEKIHGFTPDGVYDVVHESMVFQFISDTRGAQVRRMKEMLTADGIVMLEEKVHTGEVWEENEVQKDAYKSQFFTPGEMEKKKKEVLERGGDEVEGMNGLMIRSDEMESVLKRHFAHVAQYWDSGNFKGWAASDSIENLDAFLERLGDLNSEYATVNTPVDVSQSRRKMLVDRGVHSNRLVASASGGLHESSIDRDIYPFSAQPMTEKGKWRVFDYLSSEGGKVKVVAENLSIDEAYSLAKDRNSRLSRRMGPPGGSTVKELEEGLGDLSDLPVEVFVVDTYRDLPDREKETVNEYLDNAGQGSGAEAITSNNRIYLIASQIRSVERAQTVLFDHELRHVGLRRMFTQEGLERILNSAWMGKERSKMQQFATEHAINTSEPAGRLEAAEEYIVNLAETGQTNNLLQKVYAIIREYLRKKGWKIALTDLDLRHLVAKAGKAVKGEAVAHPGMFSMLSSEPPMFYSQMQRVLADKLPGSGSPAQMKKAIAAYARKGMFKAEEHEWSGVDEWLDEYEAKKVSKDEVMDFVRANEIRVETVEKGGNTGDGIIRLTPERSDEMWGERVEEEVERFEYVYVSETDITEDELTDRMREHFDEDPWVVIDGYGEYLRDTGGDFEAYETEEDAKQAIRYLFEEDTGMNRSDWEEQMRDEGYSFADEEAEEGDTKWHEETLPGGENYKELLLTLPSRGKQEPVFYDILDTQSRDVVERGVHRDNLGDMGPGMAAVPAEGEPEQAAADDYLSSHWDEPNVLAHTRFNERTDADGKRVLFIEEVQSDWHQAGREKGYVGDRPRPERLPDGWNVKDTDEGWVVLDEGGQRKIFGRETEEQAINDTLDFLARGDSKSNLSVPDAPFKTTWPLLVIKRMLRYAAGNDFDRVAWTTGGQQAERSGEAVARIKRVHWTSTDVGMRHVTLRADGRDFSLYVDVEKETVRRAVELRSDGTDRDVDVLEKKPLHEAVGKEIAERIISEEKGSLEGTDIVIGGHGQRTFYDKMLPAALNKYVKKWGARVGETSLPQLDPHMTHAWGAVSVSGTPLGTFATQNEAHAVASSHDGGRVVPAGEGTAVHSLDITPAMRESVMQGQPMMARKASTTSPEFKAWAEGTKVVDEKGEPLEVYHGTTGDFDVFDVRRQSGGALGAGFYFARDVDVAESAGPHVSAVFLSLKRPLILSKLSQTDLSEWNSIWEDDGLEAQRKAISEGYDGIHDDLYTDGHYVVFRPEQIKSAIGNQGTFDPNNPDIRMSRKMSRIKPDKLFSTTEWGEMLDEKGAVFPDESYVSWVVKGDITYLTGISVSTERQKGDAITDASGTELILWLRQHTGKPVYVVGSSDESIGFYEKLTERGIINGWTEEEVAKFFEVEWSDGEVEPRWTTARQGGQIRLSGDPVPAVDPSNPDIRMSRKAGLEKGRTKSIEARKRDTAFQAWFEGSEVVDIHGEPLTVFHGSQDSFSEFDPDLAGSRFDNPVSRLGFFFSDATSASRYAKAEPGGTERGTVYPAYLSIRNPAHIDGSGIGGSNQGAEAMAELISEAADAGHDGAIIRNWNDGSEADVQYVVFQPTQIKSAIGNQGTFDPNNPDIRMSRKAPQVVSLDESMVDVIRHHVQDKFIGLRRVQEGIGNVPEEQDAYLEEELYHGRIGEQLQDFEKQVVTPLLDDVSKAKLTLDEVGEYLHARHASEANAQLKSINPDREDNESLSGMSDADAVQAMARFRAEGHIPALREIADQVDDINERRLDMLVESGLETQETVDAWRATYQHYITLKRDVSDLPAKGRGFSIIGKESKTRVGSNLPVSEILANTIAQFEASAIRGAKNRVGQALLRLAEANPDPTFWKVDTKVFKGDRNKSTGLVEFRPDPMHKYADNVVSVKVEGVEHIISFEAGNSSAARIAESMKNLGADNMGYVTQSLAMVNRVLAYLNTSASPEFIISNFARDFQTAGYNLAATEMKGLEMKVLASVPKAWKGIRSQLYGKDGGVWAEHFNRFRHAGAKTGWIDHYRNIEAKRSNLERELTARESSAKGVTWKFIKSLAAVIETENMSVENAVRLSAFVHAMEAGMTEKKAASLAKNLTVNFNRKGSMGPALNAFYLFYNASIQGSVRLIQAAKSSRRTQAMMAGTVAFAAFLDVLNRAIGGEDDDGENRYDKVPPWIKERNLVIMKDDGSYYKIPLPWGYNVLHTIGQGVGEAVDPNRNGFSATRSAGNIMAAAVSSFNPMGSEATLAQWVSPTITDPIVMWSENKDFAGRPLRPEQQPYDVPRPEYQQHWNSVRAPSKAVAKALNDLTGGTEFRPGAINVSPEMFDLFWDTFTGSAGRFVVDSVATPIKAMQGEDITTHEVPIVRKVMGSRPEFWTRTAFYDALGDVRYLEVELKEATKERRQQLSRDPRRGLIMAGKTMRKRVREMRRVMDRIDGSKMSKAVKKARKKVLQDRIDSTMSRFVREYRRRTIDEAA